MSEKTQSRVDLAVVVVQRVHVLVAQVDNDKNTCEPGRTSG
jgi:hypothetical protein